MPGNCRTNANCVSNPTGPLCGAQTFNFCGPCSNDTQCATATPAKPVCDTLTGQCVSGACTPNPVTSAPASCPTNQEDMCCTGVCQLNTGLDACCGSGPSPYCTTLLKKAASCISNVCTTCAAVNDGQYTVDPIHGNDATGTGSGATCALQTITRALEIIGSGAVIQNTIRQSLVPPRVGSGKTFSPITILAQNVSVITTSGAVTVAVPKGKAGFMLMAGGTGSPLFAGISGGVGAALTISGQGSAATYGIVASTGSSASTEISSLTVSGFLDDGIFVENAGVLSIGAGVVSTGNGTASARKAGLHVTGTGQAIIDVPVGAATTAFRANTNHGILVDSSGSIVVTGVVTNPTTGTGTVIANGNYAAGLWIQQNPNGGAPLPQNVINGLVSFGNTNGNGMRFLGGSNVKLRNSVSLGNQASGVMISAYPAQGGNPPNDNIGSIDLGSPSGPDYGGNVFQEGLGSAGANRAAGICLMMGHGAGTLTAAGNTFALTNCAAGGGTLSINKNGCANSGCAGGSCDLGVNNGNDVNVSQCSHP